MLDIDAKTIAETCRQYTGTHRIELEASPFALWDHPEIPSVLESVVDFVPWTEVRRLAPPPSDAWLDIAVYRPGNAYRPTELDSNVLCLFRDGRLVEIRETWITGNILWQSTNHNGGG